VSSEQPAGRANASRQTRSLSGLLPKRRSDYLRLAGAAALVGIGIAVGLALSGGSSHAAHESTSAPVVAGAPAGPAASGATASAVAEALRHGQMYVVVDQPSQAAFAEVSRPIDQGEQVAAEEANAEGKLPGHLQIRLVGERLDGLSASAVQERLRADAAGVLVLPCDSDSQRTLAAAAARYGTLMLAPCDDEPTAAEHLPTYWPVGSAANEEMAELASFMAVQGGYLNAFIVTAPGMRYVELLTNYFRRAAQSKNIRIVGTASIDPNAQNLSGVAKTIKAIEPRPAAVFTALPPPVVNRLGAAFVEQGVATAIIGASVTDSRVTLAGGNAENAVVASYGFPREDPAGQRYASDYSKQFGRAPAGSLPGVGYETVRLLEEAVRHAHSGEPSAIQHVLATGFVLNGVALADRRYRAGANHNPFTEAGVEKVAGKSFEPLIAGIPTGAPSP
jgi:ABC-type branched-subunit amino acid transport system substrate-binding protein